MIIMTAAMTSSPSILTVLVIRKHQDSYVQYYTNIFSHQK